MPHLAVLVLAVDGRGDVVEREVGAGKPREHAMPIAENYVELPQKAEEAIYASSENVVLCFRSGPVGQNRLSLKVNAK